MRDRVGELLEQHHPVRQLGERVVPHAVREKSFDALVLRYVVHDAEQAAIGGPVLGHLDDVDIERAPTVLERDGERDRLACECRSRECRDVRYEHVGRQHGAKVVAEMAFEIEPEQIAVAGVGVDEAADLVVTDPDDERRLRQRVEHHPDVGRGGCGPRGPAACIKARLPVGRAVCASPRLRPIHGCLPQRSFSSNLSAARTPI